MEDELTRAILAALGDAKRVEGGSELQFICPSHADERPSAQLNLAKQVWHCKVCGTGGGLKSLAEALGIALPKKEPKATVSATYDYHDGEGRLLFQAVRLIPKAFRQRRPDGAGGWVWNLNGIEPVLYRLPELRASGAGRVFIVEGEKDVDRLREAGLTATTNAMGAGKWRPSYNNELRGREVVIVPDNDKPGREHCAAVAQSLTRDGITVRALYLQGLPEKGDVSDWLAAGHRADELAALADAAPVWAAQKPTAAAPSIDSRVNEFPLTEAGNGELFAYLHGDRCRYDWLRGRWLVWLGQRWGPDPQGLLYRWALDTARQRARAAEDVEDNDLRRKVYGWAIASESQARQATTLEQARKEEPVADLGEGWDAHPLLLGCDNGVVNLATGELRPGRQEDRITLSTRLHYDAAASCPRWERFISEVMCGDAEMVSYLQRLVGYCLTGSTREQMWALLHGKGSNGKSTFLNVLGWLAGDYGGVIAMATIEKGRDRGIPADMAALAGKRLVTTSETTETATLNEGRIKSLTGGDLITARELYQKQFTFEPQLKLLVGLNHLPRVDDDSEGFWRRVHRIPFARQFEAHERQRDLDEVLRAELPGILAWAVRGAVAWNANGLMPPDKVLLATADYRIQADPLGAFISDCCVLGPNMRATRSQLYKAYSEWCDAQGYRDRDRIGAPSFGRRVTERFELASLKSHGQRAYTGIGLRAEGENGGRYGGAGDATTSEAPIFDKTPEPLEPSRGVFQTASLASPASPCPCSVGHDDDEGCDGLGYWLDSVGDYHCEKCHPEDVRL